MIVLLSVVVALIRLFVPTHTVSWPGTYEAFAHIWCGYLIALAILRPAARKVALWSLIVITALEAALFFHGGLA